MNTVSPLHAGPAEQRRLLLHIPDRGDVCTDCLEKEWYSYHNLVKRFLPSQPDAKCSICGR